MANTKRMEDILSDLDVTLKRRSELLKSLRTYREENPSYRNSLIKTWTRKITRSKAFLLANKWLVEDGNGERFWTPGTRRNCWPRNQLRIQRKIADIMAQQMIKKAQRVRLRGQGSPQLFSAERDAPSSSPGRRQLRSLKRPNYVERGTTDIFLESEDLPQVGKRPQPEAINVEDSLDRSVVISIEESDWEQEHEFEPEPVSLVASRKSMLPRPTVNIPCRTRQLTTPRFTPPPSERDSDEDPQAMSSEPMAAVIDDQQHIALSPFRNRWTAVNGKTRNQAAQNPVPVPQNSGQAMPVASSSTPMPGRPRMLPISASTPVSTPQPSTQGPNIPLTDATGKLFLELELQKIELNRQRLELDRERMKFDREEKRQRRQAEQEYKSQKMEYQKKVLSTQQQMLEILQRDSHQRRRYAEFRCRPHNKIGCGTCQASLMCLNDPIMCQTRLLSSALPVRS